MKILEDAIKQLQQLIDNLVQEKNHLSIVGRALSSDAPNLRFYTPESLTVIDLSLQSKCVQA